MSETRFVEPIDEHHEFGRDGGAIHKVCILFAHANARLKSAPLLARARARGRQICAYMIAAARHQLRGKPANKRGALREHNPMNGGGSVRLAAADCNDALAALAAAAARRRPFDAAAGHRLEIHAGLYAAAEAARATNLARWPD